MSRTEIKKCPETSVMDAEPESWVRQEIVRLANSLPLEAFFELRDQFDAIEERKWQDFLRQTPRQNRLAQLTDDMIDATILRPRRKQRHQIRRASSSSTPINE